MGRKNFQITSQNRSKIQELSIFSFVVMMLLAGPAWADNKSTSSAASTAVQAADPSAGKLPPGKVDAPAIVPGADGDKAADDKAKKEVVKTGVIASQTKTGYNSAIDVDTSGDSPGDEANAITGSVTRSSKNECVAKITNNGKLSYSVSFAVEGTNPRGSKVLNQYYSATLKPKGTIEKTVTQCSQDLNLAVNLKSARALK